MFRISNAEAEPTGKLFRPHNQSQRSRYRTKLSSTFTILDDSKGVFSSFFDRQSVKGDSQNTSSKRVFHLRLKSRDARVFVFLREKKRSSRVRRAMHSRSARSRVNCLMKELREIDASVHNVRFSERRMDAGLLREEERKYTNGVQKPC